MTRKTIVKLFNGLIHKNRKGYLYDNNEASILFMFILEEIPQKLYVKCCIKMPFQGKYFTLRCFESFVAVTSHTCIEMAPLQI